MAPKQFKALRHAVYDEVRKEYAPEWQQYYKDAKAAEQSAEAWSKSSVTRALYFAKEGRWEEGGNAFADRDSVRDAVTAELNERKSDLKARQTEDLRERQRVACDGLREQRDVQYQELLQRQREERGAFNAGVTLDALGIAQERAGGGQTVPVPGHTANENQNGDQAAVQEPKTQPGHEASQQDAKPAEQQRGEDWQRRSTRWCKPCSPRKVQALTCRTCLRFRPLSPKPQGSSPIWRPVSLAALQVIWPISSASCSRQHRRKCARRKPRQTPSARRRSPPRVMTNPPSMKK